MSAQSNDPLHGITLEKMVTSLVAYYGWEEGVKPTDQHSLFQLRSIGQIQSQISAQDPVDKNKSGGVIPRYAAGFTGLRW